MPLSDNAFAADVLVGGFTDRAASAIDKDEEDDECIKYDE